MNVEHSLQGHLLCRFGRFAFLRIIAISGVIIKCSTYIGVLELLVVGLTKSVLLLLAISWPFGLGSRRFSSGIRTLALPDLRLEVPFVKLGIPNNVVNTFKVADCECRWTE